MYFGFDFTDLGSYLPHLAFLTNEAKLITINACCTVKPNSAAQKQTAKEVSECFF